MKIRKYIQELFTKPINMSVKDMDKFEEKEMKTVCKKDLVWLVNYIPNPIKMVGGVKEKIMSL